MFSTVKCHGDEPFIHHCKNHRRILEVECRFREDCLACQEGLCDTCSDLSCPGVVFVIDVCERHQESGIGYTLHGREKPLRPDRSRVP